MNRNGAEERGDFKAEGRELTFFEFCREVDRLADGLATELGFDAFLSPYLLGLPALQAIREAKR